MFKLVRDKIPEIMLEDGKNPITKMIQDDAEYFSALTDKLLEEVQEFIEASAENSNEHALHELADIAEVVEVICQHKKYQADLIEKYKVIKKQERGGFEKRILLLCNSIKKD
jgi:predicted house-cleaning noncanonical NTP pyrophosphatase (MazG superfamily)